MQAHAAALANLLGGRELAAGVPGPGDPIDEPTREQLDRLLAEALREPDTGLDDAALQVLAPGGRVLYSTRRASRARSARRRSRP